MSERKVLNKYYPPDFDPAKIPKLKLPRNRQYTIRIMAPFNMRCGTCGEYIYKGKKFNSRKETVEDEDYLGLRIFRFYIKCPRCVAEIAFKTDPQNTDYSLEAGATRNFEASKTAEIMAKREAKEKEEEELNNPMKVLESRTKASQQEMEMIETLEELKELNARQRKVNFDEMIETNKAEAARAYEAQLKALQDEEDEMIKMIYQKTDADAVKRLHESDEEEDQPSTSKIAKTEKPTDVLTIESGIVDKKQKKPNSWERSIGGSGSMSSKSKLSMLVKKKTPSSTPSASQSSSTIVAKSATVNTANTSNSAEIKDTDSKGESAAKSGVKTAAPSGLGLLGAYSDTDSDSNNSA